MRYLFRFLFALALSLALMAGCSEENGQGGSGGAAGTGGMGGEGGSGGAGDLCEGVQCNDQEYCTADACDPANGVCDYAPIEDGTPCPPLFVDPPSGSCVDGFCTGVACEDSSECDDNFDCSVDACDPMDGLCHYTQVANGVVTCLDAGTGTYGYCIAGFCALLDCFGVEDGAAACLYQSDLSEPGICAGGSCEARCEADADCSDYKDCTTEMCMAPGYCTDPVPVENGTPCAGGTCQDGECSLESSVLPCTEQGVRNANAAGGGPYTFDCDGPATIVTEAEIVIDHDVILDGQGNLTVDGNKNHRVFSVQAGTTVEIRGFSVTGGSSSIAGGGILNEGALTLRNSTVSGNTTNGPGGGIDNEFDATLVLLSSTVSGNVANSGGGISSSATLTVTNSTVSGNTAEFGGGGIYTNSTFILTNSTVSGNTAGDNSGGIYCHYGPVTVTNSTVSGNTASYGGSIYLDDGSFALINSTVSGTASSETDPYRRGIVIDNDTLTLTNTLLDVECAIGQGGATESGGHNIESPGNTCGFDTNKGDQVNVTAEQLNLGPLQDNGGPTETYALLPGSVAIDIIPEADCVDADGARLTTDQRGEPRPETGGTLCDVGAFEVQP